MIQPDPIAMLVGTILFLIVVVVAMAVTAVRRRVAPDPATGQPATERTGTRRFVG